MESSKLNRQLYIDLAILTCVLFTTFSQAFMTGVKSFTVLSVYRFDHILPCNIPSYIIQIKHFFIIILF